MNIKTTAIAAALAIAYSAALLVPVATADATPADKVTICHATSSESNPYVTITVNASAYDGEGNNDHTSHAGDYAGECVVWVDPNPTPNPTPQPQPQPQPDPQPTPEPIVDPYQYDEPEITIDYSAYQVGMEEPDAPRPAFTG